MKEQCVFVNTEQQPTKVKRLGLFKYEKDFSNETSFSELCEVFYPHPDAPEHALVSVFRFLDVEFPFGFDSTAMFIVDAMKGLQKAVVKGI